MLGCINELFYELVQNAKIIYEKAKSTKYKKKSTKIRVHRMVE